MPNRILRDWTDSETVDQLSIQAERFFTRLIMKADDYGRYTANLKMLKSTLFPLKTDVRETDISLWLTECEQCGLIALYNIAMRDYLQIENFKQQLRQKNEKYPPPTNGKPDDKQMHSTRIADAQQTPVNSPPETKRSRKEEEESIYISENFFSDLTVGELSSEQLINFWQAFKIQCGKDYHPNRNEVIKHFRNWLKNEKNGRASTPTGNKSNRDKQADASAALVEKLRSVTGTS
jgi:hypothetical protein